MVWGLCVIGGKETVRDTLDTGGLLIDGVGGGFRCLSMSLACGQGWIGRTVGRTVDGLIELVDLVYVLGKASCAFFFGVNLLSSSRLGKDTLAC